LIQKFLMSQEKLKEEVLNIAKEESWT